MFVVCLLSTMTFMMIFAVPSNAQTADYQAHAVKVAVTVNTSSIVRTMSYGTGENIWTAGDQIPGGPGMKPGNVPGPADETWWREIFRHADWLGLDFLRIEMEQHMYNPDQKGVYTWNSDDMRALERWLTWSQAHKVDVLLMFRDTGVEWNKIDGIHPVRSAAKNVDACLDSFIDCIDHLLNSRGYSCIKMVGFVNEPNLHWWEGGVPIAQAWKSLRAKMDARGFSSLPLAGTDESYDVPGKPFADFTPDSSHWASFGVYDFHNYGIGRIKGEATKWINKARRDGKPIIVGEYGDRVTGAATADYKTVLGVARWTLIQLNAGIDGLCHWEFADWDDMDGKWSMINLWNPYKKDLVLYYDIAPKINQYYLIGLIHRFIAKNSSVLKTSKDNDDIFTAALRSPNGNYSIYELNYSDTANHDVTVTLDNLAEAKTLYRYKITENEKDRIDVVVDHSSSFNVTPSHNSFTDTVQKNSLYVYSSFHLNPDDNGIMTDDGTSSSSQAHPFKSGGMPLSLPGGVKLGYVDSSSISNIGLHFNKVHLIHRATIRSIGIYVNFSSSGKILLGIYKSKDEKPYKLIASCKEFEPVKGWNTLEVKSQVECDPGDYWVAWLPSSGSLNVRQRMKEPRVLEGYSADVGCPYGPLPDIISDRMNYSNTVSSIYAYFTYTCIATHNPEVNIKPPKTPMPKN